MHCLQRKENSLSVYVLTILLHLQIFILKNIHFSTWLHQKPGLSLFSRGSD